MLRRRLLAFAAVGAALAVVLDSASFQSGPPRGAPVALDSPRVTTTADPLQDIAIASARQDWRSPDGLPVSLRYSWLRCDLEGAHCVALPGRHERRMVPPQESAIITLRGVVTATNAHGSRTLVTHNFFFVHAGIPLDVRGPPQFDPKQLRQWFGLRPGQDGAGQTIAIVDARRAPGLRAAVDDFSAHYGLPRACGPRVQRDCFRLELRQPFGRPSFPDTLETELDVEWAHAVAPRARIVVVEADELPQILRAVRPLAQHGNVHVISSSYCDPCGRFTSGSKETYAAVADTCHLPHVVCTFASGDRGSPGDGPSNSRYALAVGGSEFSWNPDGSIRSEVAWPSGGFGVTSVPQRRPEWQSRAKCSRVAGAFSCSYRAIPDVSGTATGAPTVVPLNGELEWHILRGTSLASPLWAALIALTDQELAAHAQPLVGIDELHRVLYRGWVAAGLDDLTHPGWNWATGLGSPKAGIVDALTQAIERYRSGVGSGT